MNGSAGGAAAGGAGAGGAGAGGAAAGGAARGAAGGTPPDFGIDVVDLRNPRTRGRHLDPRFMERVFSPAERRMISSAPDPQLEVWRFWAAKEAAFKAVGIRRHPEAPPAFAHPAFSVSDRRPEGGALRWEDLDLRLAFETDPRGRWVAAIAAVGDIPGDVAWSASDTEETSVRLGVHDRNDLDARLGPEELRAARGFTHALARLAARTDVARRLGLDPGRLEIVNPPGPAGRTPPLVHLDAAPCARARVSLSHDGTMIAWATWAADPGGQRARGR